jgi:thymidylate synthase ThyX
MISAKVIEDSISPAGKRLTTFQLKYPRFIHGEVMTHRVFSRNASSSRAIPVAKMIEQVRNDPAMPVHWGKNQPGMQAREEHDAPVMLFEYANVDAPTDNLFTGFDQQFTIQEAWIEAAHRAAEVAEAMNKAGYHKQVVNRLLEPFQWMQTIVTATEWDNFFELRAHEDAQPEIHELAMQMSAAMGRSLPEQRKLDRTDAFNWHLPYVSDNERLIYMQEPEIAAKLSVARCARVSYLTHDGQAPQIEKDLELYDRLVGSRPLHASPTEHQAYPMAHAAAQSKNFFGWRQFRERVEFEAAA